MFVPSVLHTNQPSQTECVPGLGARKVWVTVNHATLDGVSSTIIVLGKVAPNVVSVKRKYKTARDNSICWWFVLRGEECSKRA